MGQTTIGSPSAKTIGVTGEQLFAFRALEEGLVPSVPIGDNCQYDFLIDSSKRISRVQVKSSSACQTDRKSGNCFSFYLKHAAKDIAYDSDAVDFFGLVVLPIRTIYIVPYNVFAKVTKASVYPLKKSRSKLEPYREAWCLL
jgi:hypothetical protein